MKTGQREFPHPHGQRPSFTPDTSVVRLSQVLTRYYQLRPTFCPDFLMPPSLSHPGFHIPFSPCVPLGTSRPDQVLRLSLLPMAILRTSGQVFYRKSIPWGLSDVVLTVRRGLQIQGRKTTEVKCLLMIAHRGSLSLLMLTLVIWLVSVCQLSPLCSVSSPVHLWLFVGGRYVQRTSQKWGGVPPNGSYLPKLLEFSNREN